MILFLPPANNSSSTTNNSATNRSGVSHASQDGFLHWGHPRRGHHGPRLKPMRYVRNAEKKPQCPSAPHKDVRYCVGTVSGGGGKRRARERRRDGAFSFSFPALSVSIAYSAVQPLTVEIAEVAENPRSMPSKAVSLRENSYSAQDENWVGMRVQLAFCWLCLGKVSALMRARSSACFSSCC